MKLKHVTICFVLILSYSSNYLFSQTIEEQMTKSHPTCSTMLMNAMDILPQLYKKKSFDSLHKAIDIWERSCFGMPEVKLTRILLNMEESNFVVSRDVDLSTIEALSNYAKQFPSADKVRSGSSYNEPMTSFYRFSSAWATLLLQHKKMGENEKFICDVLSGEVKNPEKEIRQNPETYPEFAALLENEFEYNRRTNGLNMALSTGVWIPTNNLSTLGVHPSFGFHVGGRSEHHELDLTIQIRYLYSANTYVVKRYNYLDSTDYYFGGYIGLDYAYYFVSKKRCDVGVVAGIGWDGFDFAEQPYNPYVESHVTIGSFNANAGLRFNYYFTHSVYVGLQSRYNGINYSTHGGTNLSGDAVSIDLFFGFHASNPN